MVPKTLAQQAVRAVRHLRQRVLPNVAEGDVIGLRLPGEDAPCFAVPCNEPGFEEGLVIYRSSAALTELCWPAASSESDDSSATDHDHTAEAAACDIWQIIMDRPGRVRPELQTIAKLAGYSAREVPLFLVDQPGRPLREAYRGELRAMLLAMRAVLQAQERSVLEPRRTTRAGTARIQTLSIRGKSRDLEIRAEHETFEIPPPPWLRDLPELDNEWIIATQSFDADERVLAVVDAESGTEIVLLFAAQDLPLEVQTREILDALRGSSRTGIEGVPRRLVFADQELCNELAPMLQSRQVECVVDPELELPLEIPAGLDPARVPAPDDEMGWIAVNQRLGRRIGARKDWAPHLSKPRELYFGAAIDPDDVDHYLADIAYEDWYALHYRGGKDRRTVAERLLDEELPEPERMQQQARADARLGLWVVERLGEDGAEFLERTSGERVEVVHEGLVALLQEGSCIPGGMGSLQDREFLLFFGPPIPAPLIDEAVQHLQGLGLDPTPDGLAAAPHLLGRLWLWLAHRQGLDGTTAN